MSSLFSFDIVYFVAGIVQHQEKNVNYTRGVIIWYKRSDENGKKKFGIRLDATSR